MTNIDKKNMSKTSRRSPRYEYRGQCTLATCSESCSAHLINLSDNGALIAVLDVHSLEVGERVRLNVVGQSGANISIRGKIAHIRDHYSGVEFAPETEEDQCLLRDFIEKTKNEAN